MRNDENDTFCNEDPSSYSNSPLSINACNEKNRGDASSELDCTHGDEPAQQQQPLRRKNILLFLISPLIVVSMLMAIIALWWRDVEFDSGWTGGRKGPLGDERNDEYFWPFHSGEGGGGGGEVTKSIAKGKLGRVFTVELGKDSIVPTNNNNLDNDVGVISRYHFRSVLGKVRMK
eukprot:4147595-Ditylum_brightwellii.AAC.1